jgi:hypothetical protein
MNLWYGYRDLLPADVRAATEAHFKSFKYWYTDPQPAGVIDQRYYWSENHRLLYHADEYLAGQAFPNDVFSSDGNTGAWHMNRAHGFIDTWLTEKAKYGFTEWHSDVYYQKTFDALITIAEWVQDPTIARRASMVLDLLLFDIALHLQKGNDGATHGRSYMKDKSVATDQDIFNLSKLLFDDTRFGYNSTGDPGATLMARAQRYHVPAVILRVAQSKQTTVDQEHMGVPLDPAAPVDRTQTGIDGHSFTDPAEVEFWWEKGGQTAWQTVPLTMDTLDRYGLWESDFFKDFKPLADLTGGDRAVAQDLAQSLQSMLGFALLGAVDTYTYRSDSVMLSTAQSYRPGYASEQHHISQATLDEQAIVFTTHPKNEPQSGTQWPDDDGYWTGNGSLPRAAQHGALSISLYAPAFAAHRVPLPRLHACVLPAGALRRGRAAERLDVRTPGQRLRGAVVVAADAVAHVHRPGDLHPRAHEAVRPRRAGRRRRRVVHPGRRLDAVPGLRDVPGGRAAGCDLGATASRRQRTARRLRRELPVADRGPGHVRDHGSADGEGQALRQPVGTRRLRRVADHDRRHGGLVEARLRRVDPRRGVDAEALRQGQVRTPRPALQPALTGTVAPRRAPQPDR